MSISQNVPSLSSVAKCFLVMSFYSSNGFVVNVTTQCFVKNCEFNDKFHSGCDGTVCCTAQPCIVDDSLSGICNGSVCCTAQPCIVDGSLNGICNGSVCCTAQPCIVDGSLNGICNGSACRKAQPCTADNHINDGCNGTVCCPAQPSRNDNNTNGVCNGSVCCTTQPCIFGNLTNDGCNGTVCCAAQPFMVDGSINGGYKGSVCYTVQPGILDDHISVGFDGTVYCTNELCIDDEGGYNGTVCCIVNPCIFDDDINGGCDGTICCSARPCVTEDNAHTSWIAGKDKARDVLFGHYTYSVTTGTTKTLCTILRLVTALGWNTVTIIHDSSEEASVSWLINKLSSAGIQIRIHTYSSNISIDFNSFSGEDTTLIMCSVTCLSRIISQASQYAKDNHMDSILRHASRWLITVRQPTPLPVLDVVLDNVAAIVITSPTPNSCSQEQLIYYTLLWSKEGRHFHRITNKEKPVHEHLYPNSRRGFNGRKFLVGTLEWPPFVFLHNQTYSGFCVDLLNIVRDRLNFTYEFVQPEDKQYGAHIGNGVWSGLVGQLQNKAVEMSVTDISITYEREKIVDFAFPFMMDTASIIVRQSTDDKRKIWTFTSPFTWEVYVCLALAFIILFVMVIAVELSNWKNSVASTRMLKRVDIFWYMFGVPFRQGNELMFRHARSRVLLGCWWALTCLVTASFCCNLIAFLTVNTQSPPFETALEMATRTNFKWGCVSGGSFLTQFKMSNVTVHKLLLEGIQKFSQSDPDILSPNQDVHLKKLLTEDYAFIAGRPISNYWRSRHCQLRMLKDNFFPVRYSFAFPNGSPYKKIVSDIILRLLDTGVIERLTQAWWPKNRCSQPAKTKGQVVTLVDVQSAFYSLLFGVVVAGVVLLVERVHRR